MARARRTGKKQSAALSPEAQERVLAAALEHPEIGVRRLARMLKDMGISASESVIRAALKKEGLHTVELRLRFQEERRAAEDLAPSAQEPEQFKPGRPELAGATELPALPDEDLAAMEAVETKTRPVNAQKVTEFELANVSVPPTAAAPAHVPPPPRPARRVERRPSWEQWLFQAVNAGLICLAVYLIWAVASKFIYPGRHDGDDAVLPAAAPDSPGGPQAAPLDDYQVVWERDLFGTSKAAEGVARRESAAVEKIAVAEKDLGLRLIGTVVADDPLLNHAVIDVAATRKQGIFRERERVGRAVIRRILRNTVIIQTDTGQRRRLTVDYESAKTAQALAAELPKNFEAPTWVPPPPPPEVLESAATFQVPQQAVEPLAESSRLAEETRMSQHFADGEPGGLHLGAVTPGNPLARIGLRTGDVVKALNDEKITGPGEAEVLFRALARRGDFDILVERRGRLQHLKVNIE